MKKFSSGSYKWLWFYLNEVIVFNTLVPCPLLEEPTYFFICSRCLGEEKNFASWYYLIRNEVLSLIPVHASIASAWFRYHCSISL